MPVLQDQFLLSCMNSQLFVPVQTVAAFPNIRKLSADVAEVLKAMEESTAVTVSADKADRCPRTGRGQVSADRADRCPRTGRTVSEDKADRCPRTGRGHGAVTARTRSD